MNSGEKVKHGALWSVLFAVVSLAWIFPIVLVIINSFKQKAYISRNAFSCRPVRRSLDLKTIRVASIPRTSSPVSAGPCSSLSVPWR